MTSASLTPSTPSPHSSGPSSSGPSSSRPSSSGSHSSGSHSSGSHGFGPGELRVSDADRNLVTDVLNSAYAEGRITRDELDERTTLVMTSKTFNDLTPLTADLMAGPLPEQYRSTTVASHGDATTVAIDPHGEASDQITSIMSSAKRESGWRMAKKSNATAILGDVKLDLRGGAMAALECELNVTNVMGEVKLFVPEGVAIHDRTTKILSDVKIKGTRPAPAGAPIIVLTGVVCMGDVTVYGPDHQSLGKRLGLTKN